MDGWMNELTDGQWDGPPDGRNKVWTDWRIILLERCFSLFRLMPILLLMNFWETKTWKCHMYLKICNVHGLRGNDKNRKYLKFEQYRIRFFGVTEAHAIYGRKMLRINQDCG